MLLSLGPAAFGREMLGRVLGDYRITGLIAEGGMGQVFRAERMDGSFDRDVAIKISPGSGMNQELRDRFLREQRFLAGLNHPNISQLYDAGVTEEGWPFLVMELVDGVAIDEWVARRELDSRAIVELMLEVVEAVAYAHKRLIVHRDIKASNVMVTAEGRPKLLDFGIAKPLDPQAAALTTAYPLTPRSASPEQLLGQPITTASDIYQLGLLLLRLLTGGSPVPEESLSDAIQRAAAARPLAIDARVRHLLPRELALIIEQCLRSNAEERYAGANALRDDLVAWRDGYPVSATGQGWAYRFGKLLARNKAATVTAAAAVLAAVAGVSWYTWQLAEARDAALAAQRSAEREASAAEQARAESEAVLDFLTRMLTAANPNRDGREVRVVEVIEQAAEALETNLGDRPHVKARIHGEIGETYRQLGLHEEAEAQQDAKLAIYDELGETKHPGRAEALYDLIWLQRERGALDEAARTGEQVVDLRREIYGVEHPATLSAIRTLAEVHVDRGDYDAAEPMLLETVAVQRKVLGEEHSATASAMAALARMYSSMGRYEEAIALYRRVLAIDMKLYGEENLGTLVTMGNLLEALNKSGRKAEALAGRRRQLELMTRLVGEDHPYTYVTMVNLAMAFEATEEHFAERESLLLAAIEGHRRQSGPEHPRVILARHNLGKVYRLHARYNEAVAVHRENLPRVRRIMGEESPRTMYSIGEYATALCRQGRKAEAMTLFEEFASEAPEILGADHPQLAEYLAERKRCLA